MALLVVGLAYAPYIASPSQVFPLINLFIYITLAVSWNLLAGYGGMISVGQQAYIGLGAYGLVYLADQLGLDPFLAIPLAAALAGLAALPVSFIAFRLAGGYFAVGTWVIAEVIRLLTVQVDTLGAGSGTSLHALIGTNSSLRIIFTYWFALGTAVIAVVGAVVLIRSRLGLALAAVRDDPIAAASNGIHVDRTKRVVYCLAALGTGAAGALVAISTLRVQPHSVYSVEWTAFMIFMVVIGGVSTMEGPILGAVVFFVLQETLSQYGTTYLIILGVLAVAIVLTAPKGLWGRLSRGRLQALPVGYHLRLPAPEGSRTSTSTR
jgi:branched-chain amino acid transport system permease protein